MENYGTDSDIGDRETPQHTGDLFVVDLQFAF